MDFSNFWFQGQDEAPIPPVDVVAQSLRFVAQILQRESPLMVIVDLDVVWLG